MKKDIGLLLVFCFLVVSLSGCTSNDQEQLKISKATGEGQNKQKPGERVLVDTSKLDEKQKIQFEAEKKQIKAIFAFLHFADHLFDQAWVVISDESNKGVRNIFQAGKEAIEKVYRSDGHPYEHQSDSCVKNDGFSLVEQDIFNGYELIQKQDCKNQESVKTLALFTQKNQGNWRVKFMGEHFPKELGKALAVLHENPECDFAVNQEFVVESLSCSGLGQDFPEPGLLEQYVRFSELSFVRGEKKPLVIKASVFKDLEAGLQKLATENLEIEDKPAENILQLTIDVMKKETKPTPAVQPNTTPATNPSPPKADVPPVPVAPEGPQNNNGTENNNGQGNNNGHANNNGDPLPKEPAKKRAAAPSRGPQPIDPNPGIVAGQQADGG
jgi:hypothetical protein